MLFFLIAGAFIVTRDNTPGTNVYSGRSFDDERQFLTVHTSGQMMVGQNYTLTIPSFRGPLKPDLAGLYLSSYTRNNTTM